MKSLFSPQELKQIKKLYSEASPGTFAKRLAEEILPPIMLKINIALTPNGSLVTENDPKLIAYMIENALMKGAL